MIILGVPSYPSHSVMILRLCVVFSTVLDYRCASHTYIIMHSFSPLLDNQFNLNFLTFCMLQEIEKKVSAPGKSNQNLEVFVLFIV